MEVYFPKKFLLRRLAVSHGTGKSGQIIHVTEILSSLSFENLSSTYQKGNLHCNSINPLPALHFFPLLHSSLTLSPYGNFHGQNFVVVQVMDRTFVFSLTTLSVHVRRAGGRLAGMPEVEKEPYFKRRHHRLAHVRLMPLSRLDLVLDWAV